MDYTGRLAISYYHTIAVLNKEHKVYLVQHQENQKIYIKKILDVYNLHIYGYLQSHQIRGIPKVYNVYEENDQLTIIEEFISGTSLREIIDARTLSSDLIIRYICELCDILGELHSFHPPIVHRDIKPSNIIVTPYDHIVLIDFNAAKYLTDQNGQDTMLLGTKGYAAPEQYGFGSSTPQTDIYALGILIRELSSALPVSTNIFHPIIHKCTQLNPSDRLEDVHALKAEMEKLKGNNVMESTSASWEKFLPPGFRTKTPWKMLVASVTYLAIIELCISLEVTDVTTTQLWIERFFYLLAMLSIVFCSLNYCNVQRIIPLCSNSHRGIRYFGVLLLDAAVTVGVFIIMLIAVSL
jgi:serine/threonine protein kinase